MIRAGPAVILRPEGPKNLPLLRGEQILRFAQDDSLE
jgi:hypothetical protein